MENIEKKNNNKISLVSSILMCVEGFLLFYSHISNGDTNIVVAGFSFLYYGIPLILTVLGLILILINRPYSRNTLLIIIASMVYLILRIASGAVNDLFNDIGYWKTICYEAFLVVGINSFTLNRRSIRILFCGLLAFDLIAISICTYHYLYLRDSMTSAIAAFPAQLQGLIPFTYIFVNPNLAGMLAGICASVCILIFTTHSKSFKLLLAPVIVINIIFMLWSNSRTSVIGTILILILCLLRRYVKSINYKTVIAASLIICALFMMPVYIMAITSNQTEQFRNSETETMLNESSSGRYNLWKSHILSQRGHYLLGFGTPSKAIIARADFLESIGEDEEIEMDETYQGAIGATTLGSHNGYLELVLTAGMPAFLVMMALLLLRIRSMDNHFIERNPVILIVIMLFWICVQEARFITSSVHYIAFLMMLLLSWKDNKNEEKNN